MFCCLCPCVLSFHSFIIPVSSNGTARVLHRPHPSAQTRPTHKQSAICCATHTHEHANRARLYECLLLWGVQHARKYIIMLFMHRQVFHRIPALYVLLLLAGWLAAWQLNSQRNRRQKIKHCWNGFSYQPRRMAFASDHPSHPRYSPSSSFCHRAPVVYLSCGSHS